MYWNARGGSHTDGGSFIFNLEKDGNGGRKLVCTDKFGRGSSRPPQDQTPRKTEPIVIGGPGLPAPRTTLRRSWSRTWRPRSRRPPTTGWRSSRPGSRAWLKKTLGFALAGFNHLLDRRYDTGDKRRRSILDIVLTGLHDFLDSIQTPDQAEGPLARVDWAAREALVPPRPWTRRPWSSAPGISRPRETIATPGF